MSVLSVTLSPAERRRAHEFDRLLEDSRPSEGHELESLVALVASLHPADFAPRAEFRATLRESLVAEAAARQADPAVARRPAPPPRRHRVRTAVATGVLVSLVGGVGAAAASTHALPGDPLYGLKRGLESAQLRFDHSDLSRGRDLLDQADNRLSEAESLAASEDARSPETTARIAAAIADLEAATRAGAASLEASYADTGDVEPLVELDRFVVDQRERLADLATLLNPDLRALLAPLTELLRTLQPHLESLVASTSGSPGAGGASASTGVPAAGGTVAGRPPLTGNGVDVADTINGLTGGDPSAADPGAAVGAPGGLGGSAGTSSLPSAVPRPPRSAVPSVHVPSVSAVPVPSLPVPSVPVPSVSVPAVPVPTLPVPTPSTTPSLPLGNVTPPVCVPVAPLTHC